MGLADGTAWENDYGKNEEKIKVISYKRLIEVDGYLLKLSNGETLQVSTPLILSFMNAEGMVESTTMRSLLTEVANHILNKGKDED